MDCLKKSIFLSAILSLSLSINLFVASNNVLAADNAQTEVNNASDELIAAKQDLELANNAEAKARLSYQSAAKNKDEADGELIALKKNKASAQQDINNATTKAADKDSIAAEKMKIWDLALKDQKDKKDAVTKKQNDLSIANKALTDSKMNQKGNTSSAH